MTLDALIEKAARTGLSVQDVDASASALHLARADLLDRCARVIADRFLRGEYTWTFSDEAMNGIYGFAYAGSDTGLSAFSMAVYEAFDSGEIDAPSSTPEDRTRDLLRRTLLKIVEQPPKGRVPNGQL